MKRTRTCKELLEWTHVVPAEPLLAITKAEARQFILTYSLGGRHTLCGRPCIIIDLAPGEVLLP